MLKEIPKIENIVLTNLDYVHKLRLSKYICRVHNLPVTYNRFNFKEKDASTFCPLCNDKNLIGDESHYLFECNFFDKVRKRYWFNGLYNNADISLSWKKIINLDTKSLVGVSRFIKIIQKQFDSKFSSRLKIDDNDYVLKTTETRFGRKIKIPKRFDS